MSLLGRGPEVDPEDGALELEPRGSKNADDAALWLERYNRLIEDLSGKGGPVVKTVVAALQGRVNELMEADLECKAYLKILTPLNRTVNYGQKIVEFLANELLKHSGPGSQETPDSR